MELFDAIDSRVSAARLSEPGPSAAHLERLIQAAGRAPDHGRLQPWRFFVVNGEAREPRFDRALAIDPRYAAAWYNKGGSLADLGLREEAISCYDQALAIDPGDAAAWTSKSKTSSACNALLAAKWGAWR